MSEDSKAWWIDIAGNIIDVDDIKKIFSNKKSSDDIDAELSELSELAVYRGAIRIRLLKGLYTGLFIDIDYDKCTNSSTKLFNFFDKKADEIDLPLSAKAYVYDYASQAQTTMTIKKLIDELNETKVFEQKEIK